MTHLKLRLVFACLLVTPAIRSQILDDGNGRFYMDPALTPVSLTLATQPNVFPYESILSIRGDWMPDMVEGLRGEVFRTRSGWFDDADDAFGLASHWRMLRATGPNANQRIEIGEISCNFGLTEDVFENRGFNVIAKRNGGSVWLRNRRGRPNYDAPVDEAVNDEALGNGLRLIDDSSSVGGGFPLNGYNRVPRLGYVGIGHTVNMDQVAVAGDMIMPWTRLHLVHGNGYPTYASETPESDPYRPFCRNGTSFSGNSTYAYLGHKYSMPGYPDNDDLETDSTDVLALWGNNHILPGNSHWNNFSFRFTLTPDGALGSASGLEGLEIMRLRPDQREEGGRVEGFVGIGDWVNNYPAVPEERLDLLDRTIRIRSMGPPGQYQNNSLNRVLVADPADGRVYWRDASTIGSGGGSGCNWTYVPGADRMYTATDPVSGSLCPQIDWLVGIGAISPLYKLDVLHTKGQSPSQGGIRSTYNGSATATGNVGISTTVSPENGTNMDYSDGVSARVNGLSKAGTGVKGAVNVTWSGATVSQATGTHGSVDVSAGSATEVGCARERVRLDRHHRNGTWHLWSGHRQLVHHRFHQYVRYVGREQTLWHHDQ
jgi:hypothetical protein